jgi:IclR family transcriptional regulator, pca regulon regulatory protein
MNAMLTIASTDKPALSEKSTVQSLAKGMRVLEAFRSEQPEMTLAEVARAAGLDNGTAFRFLNTLVMLGYLEKPEGKRFRLSLKCLDLGFHAIGRTSLRDLARPMLRTLIGGDIEAASLAVLDGNEIVYVERVQAGLARLGVDVRIGSRAPAHSTAVGQAMLAYIEPVEQRARLGRMPLRRMTASTITSLPKFLARLAEIRDRGYALSDQENVTGLRVLAAPILDVDGSPLAAVSVASPAFSAPLAQFERSNRAQLIRVAATLSKASQASGGVANSKRIAL